MTHDELVVHVMGILVRDRTHGGQLMADVHALIDSISVCERERCAKIARAEAHSHKTTLGNGFGDLRYEQGAAVAAERIEGLISVGDED